MALPAEATGHAVTPLQTSIKDFETSLDLRYIWSEDWSVPAVTGKSSEEVAPSLVEVKVMRSFA